jgi:hypothetical protein
MLTMIEVRQVVVRGWQESIADLYKARGSRGWQIDFACGPSLVLSTKVVVVEVSDHLKRLHRGVDPELRFGIWISFRGNG